MDHVTDMATYALAVCRRQYLVWRRILWPSLTTNVANPLLFLFAFGFGLGAVIDDMGGLGYLAFVVPGMMAYSAMFAASFETTIGAFARFNLQRTWDAVVATPVRLLELVLGETLWAGTKAMLSASCVLVVGFLWGGIDSLLGALIGLVVIFLASLTFAACGLMATAYARSWEFFSYFFTFWVTPSFMFSGVFFDIGRFPPYIETLSWLLPMTHVVAVVRPLCSGQELGLGAAFLHIAYLAVVLVLTFLLAYRRLRARMFD